LPTTLITGTSTGIGLATALHLARNGYHVFASMRDPATGSGVLTETAHQEGLQLEVLQLDVNDPDSSERAVHEVLQKAGQIDVLINNAGIGGGGPIEEMSEEFLRAVFETNFFGAMRLIRLVLPTMRKRRSGTIVNIASVLGRFVGAGGSAYSGSKFALEAASEALAQEVKRFNIRVVIIEPGVIETPIFEKNRREPDPNSPYYEFARRRAQVFDKRLKDPSPPELVAKTIQHGLETDTPKLRYLVGEDAKKWMTGRQRMTDEEWVDAGREMTSEEYAVFYADRFGIEI
jgi:NAD(P)-dependent dehydrogenase (short-subunit alcohol dehydrogenase family)